MPTYLYIARTPSNPLVVDVVTAPTRLAAAQQVKANLAAGVGVNSDGSRDIILAGLLDLAAFGTITPNPDPSKAAITQYTDQAQPSITDLPGGTPTNLAQCITAIGGCWPRPSSRSWRP